MDLEAQLQALPDRPGVYIYRDGEGRILYVGKARSLRHRVRQYFQASRNLPPKVQRMVGQIASIEHIVTDNEVEALILESNLIKRHKPKYNVKLRDDKHYPYLRLTLHEKWPRVLIARQMRRDGSRYFGPYTTSGAVHETLKLLRRLFPLRTCSDPSRYPRGCLQLHIGRCLGPCLPDFEQHAAYEQAVRDVAAFLDGKVDDVLQRLRADMERAAENLEFERAAEIRDRIRAVEKVAERQKIISSEMADRDVIAYARDQDEACVQVFFVRQGKLVGRDQFFLANTDGLSGGEILSAFIQQHYNRTNFIPPEILVSDPLEEEDLLARWLSEKRGARVSIACPQRGEKRRLVELVIQNAEESMAERQQAREHERRATEGALAELQAALSLPAPPRRIECFDVSHVQGADVVAAMVVFEDGEPKKSDYRKFKMRVDRNDDFANMAEAITRRFKRGLAEREALARARAEAQAAAAVVAAGDGAAADAGAAAGVAAADGTHGAGRARRRRDGLARRIPEEPKFAAFPDLLIIDGGKGQLSAAREALRELGLESIPTFGLAKEEELLFAEGRREPIVLPRGSAGLHLLQRVRDETHRFAVTYHRQLHRKGMSRSVLDGAPGIGPKRKRALLRAFGSLRRIREATAEELAAVPGMTREAAERLVEYLEQQREAE
ncbi:excinuclease ABC subunit UvrC [Caldinitratiruptor microaerophilus]|uniref:UvrABC system protein C n=1 Tax=Caldinitratiruptor microaerophilus TaxID=671077 RepID=A0AA35CPQ0_9FIRM|nr:excinuclease ABC subunit UvrC [Caldinitratiruptor microaerophilus]BDG61676.1 hypothetical protein caldi_27660 [Caldinitratiruptor microaerophilus]